MRPFPLLVAVASALGLFAAGTPPQPRTSPPAAVHAPRLRLVAATREQPPPDPCADYQALEAGRGAPDRQAAFNHLDARGYARWRMACVYRWDGGEFRALDDVWTPESGWYHLADGPGSCWGIPQRCPGSTMSPFGADWKTNPRVQVRAGLEYVRGRYGDPAAALRYRQAHGWY